MQYVYTYTEDQTISRISGDEYGTIELYKTKTKKLSSLSISPSNVSLSIVSCYYKWLLKTNLLTPPPTKWKSPPNNIQTRCLCKFLILSILYISVKSFRQI